MSSALLKIRFETREKQTAVHYILLAPVGFSPKWGLMDLVFIFVSMRACVRNHISEIYRPILSLLGKKTTHDGIHKHVIFF